MLLNINSLAIRKARNREDLFPNKNVADYLAVYRDEIVFLLKV